MINETDKRLVTLMIEKVERLIEILQTYGREKIEQEYVLSDAIQYEFEKLYEDSTRLSIEIIAYHGEELHINDLRSIRNRVAHDYESVSIKILLDTIENDMPILKTDLQKLL